jgi:hypothetical protein
MAKRVPSMATYELECTPSDARSTPSYRLPSPCTFENRVRNGPHVKNVARGRKAAFRSSSSSPSKRGSGRSSVATGKPAAALVRVHVGNRGRVKAARPLMTHEEAMAVLRLSRNKKRNGAFRVRASHPAKGSCESGFLPCGDRAAAAPRSFDTMPRASPHTSRTSPGPVPHDHRVTTCDRWSPIRCKDQGERACTSTAERNPAVAHMRTRAARAVLPVEP